MKKVLLSICCMLLTQICTAATYYVAPSGGSNSNPGTISQPFATLQKAHDVANAGDLIYMRGGTHMPSAQTTITRAGTSTARIRVENYPGEVAVVDGTNIPSNPGDPYWIVRIQPGGNYWHIKGIEWLNNHDGGGITIFSSGNIIEMNNVHHNGRDSSWASSGIAVGEWGSNPSNNLILNNDVHHNRDIDNGDADGIEIKHSIVNLGNIIRGNRVWRNSDDGIDLWNSKQITVEGNWVWENGFDDSLNPLGDGNGLKLGGTASGDGQHTIRQNVVWKNKAYGMTDNLADLSITYHNNSMWSNPSGSFFDDSTGPGVFRNNMSFGSLGSISSSNTSFNSWTVSGVTVDASDFQSLAFDSTCVLGPRQSDGSLPNCPFLRLVSGSDLIDKGTDVGLPFNGTAPDLGAFESSSADTTPPTVSITAPAAGATVSGTSVTVSANASDNVGVVGVQFKLDGVNLGAEDTASPYSTAWDTTSASNGSHTLTAVARDAAGNSTTSASVSVTVSNDTTPPTVSITAPAGGATIDGSPAANVSATAADNVGVVGVQFKLDGVNLGAEDTSAPYCVPWNSASTTNGSHTLTAVARDAAGNSATSAGVTVTVNNMPSC